MSAGVLKYSLETFETIAAESSDQLYHLVDEATLSTIANLAAQVGAPNYDRTPIFAKRSGSSSHHHSDDYLDEPDDQLALSSSSSSNKRPTSSVHSPVRSAKPSIAAKRRRNKNIEITDDAEWEQTNTSAATTAVAAAACDSQWVRGAAQAKEPAFKTTKMELKSGLDADLDSIGHILTS